MIPRIFFFVTMSSSLRCVVRMERSGGRAGGESFAEPKTPQVTASSAASSIFGGAVRGAGVGATSVALGTFVVCGIAHPVAHGWAPTALAFMGAAATLVPSAVVAGYLKARQAIVDSGAVRDATARTWNALVPDDTAVADTVEKAWEGVSDTLVTDFVKGAGPLGLPARWIAAWTYPALDAAVESARGEIDKQYRRRAIRDKIRVDAVLAKAVEALVVRTIEDQIFVAACVGILILGFADGSVLFFDSLLPR